jgi:hypothetical protein
MMLFFMIPNRIARDIGIEVYGMRPTLITVRLVGFLFPKSSVSDPDPVLFYPLDPGSASGMIFFRIPDLFDYD